MQNAFFPGFFKKYMHDSIGSRGPDVEIIDQGAACFFEFVFKF